ncbi:MAG: hypothetical protein EPO10_18570, partial [Reyranella sp.]
MMANISEEQYPATGALISSVGEQYDPSGLDLLDRWNRHQRWFDERAAASVDPYCKTTLGRIGPAGEMRTRAGKIHSGVNFASQDYLSLSSHPGIVAAANTA